MNKRIDLEISLFLMLSAAFVGYIIGVYVGGLPI